MDCDPAALAAYIRAPSLTHSASACTPAERLARLGVLSEALVLVSCSGSCLQLPVPDPRAVGGFSPALPGPGSRGTQEARSQQQSVTPTAAAPVRGSGSTSPAPPSPPQRVESMDAELENRCPICLDSWEEASFVMPCLHQFCYPCILQWAESKPECPLCKRGILSILHSVRADDNYVEHIITPPVAPPVTVRQVEGARRHPAARGPHQPGAPQRRAAEGVPRGPVGGLQPPNWMNNFRNHPTLLQTLQHWVHQELEELFGNGVLEPATVEGMGTELPGQMLRGSRQNHVATSGQQPARVAVQRRSREAQRSLGWQDARAARGQEGSRVGAPGPAASQGGSLTPGPPPSRSPVRSSADELPGTSPTAVGRGPSSQPPAPIAIPVEQEEPEAVLGPSASRRGSESSPEGPRRPPKRKSSSSEASPSNKRPAPHQ